MHRRAGLPAVTIYRPGLRHGSPLPGDVGLLTALP
ncbi:hypothetical protein ACVWXU_005573 [Streptomyces sp. TE33382]